MSQVRERTPRQGHLIPDEATLPDLRGRRHSTMSASWRVLGAIAVLTTGAVHLEQYFGVHFAVVPIIGPLFMLNFVGATVLGVGLLIPHARLRVMHILFALGGIGLAATSFVFLLISEHQPLFGFQDYGYRPAIIVALGAEGAAVVFLAAYLVALRGASNERRL
jgi:hypothetical protein